MKKILITGGTGLIGQSLIKTLQKNHSVINLSRHSSNLPNVENINTNFSEDWLIEPFPKDIELIIHLAQSEEYRNFPEKSMEIFNVNTYSTLKLLEYARKSGVKKFIYASSGGVYGSGDISFTEDSPVKPPKEIGFYLGTKLCSEVITENYTPFFDVIILRLFFVYGPNQNKNLLFARLLNSINSGIPITLQGDAGPKLNPIFVDDATEAINKAIHLQGSHKINVAGGEVMTLKEIINIQAACLKKNPIINYTQGEAQNIIADISKMKQLLHTPSIDFYSGIMKTIQ